jgi:hypothetical protein
MQFNTEATIFMDELTQRLIRECPEKKLSYNEFKAIILNFTSAPELDAYLVNTGVLGVSISDALNCARAFFEGRWQQILNIVNNINTEETNGQNETN